jgi:FtsH-binding integral membrane protein
MANSNGFPDFRAGSAIRTPFEGGLRQYMVQVYNYMAGGLVLTGVTAYIGAATGFYASIAHTPLFWVVVFAPLALVLLLGFRIDRMSTGAAQLCFWAYAALVGLSLSGIFLAYTGDSIARVFFITAGTFAATSVYGYTTQRDLTRFGSFLIMGLFGIIIASLVNIFLKSTALQMTMSVMGVIVFAGLAAYDTQRLKNLYFSSGGGVAVAGKTAILGALTLYLDFLNLFLMLMQLLGDRRDR